MPEIHRFPLSIDKITCLLTTFVDFVFTIGTRGTEVILKGQQQSDNKLFYPSTFNCNSIVNKFTVCMKSVSILDEQKNRYIFR